MNGNEKEIRCPYCSRIKVLIDRFNHSNFYNCPLCKGNGKIKQVMNDAEYLKSIRKALHLTQKEMADRLGYANQESISRIERGHTDMIPQAREHLKTIEKHEL